MNIRWPIRDGGRRSGDSGVGQRLRAHLASLNPCLAELARAVDISSEVAEHRQAWFPLRIEAAWVGELFEVYHPAIRERAEPATEPRLTR